MSYTLQFEQTSINPDLSVVHDNDTFRVQWNAVNLGPDITPEFVDRLEILALPEGCPGSDSEEHTVMYDSTIDGNPDDFAEPELLPDEVGPLMEPEVGPFVAGAYRLSVTLDDGGPNPVTLFNCITIVEAV